VCCRLQLLCCRRRCHRRLAAVAVIVTIISVSYFFTSYHTTVIAIAGIPSFVNGCRAESISHTNRCYASNSFTSTLVTTSESAGYTAAANPSLRLGAPTASSRKLEDVDIVHYKNDTLQLLRSEVAKAVQDALDGDVSSFQLNVAPETGEGVWTLKITENGMEVSTGDLSGAFTIKNAFLEKWPKRVYQVNCPAPSINDNDYCTVLLVDDDEVGEGEQLVNCLEKDSHITKEDIPAECGHEMYNVALYAAPGPHFFLVGIKSSDDSTSGTIICPKALAFDSLMGGKKIVSPYVSDIEALPKHDIGVAMLTDVLKAEENADAIDVSSYDMLKNNCIHYAFSIWRSWRTLGLDEAEDLADFIIANVINDDSLGQRASNWRGGRRLLSAVEDGIFETFVRNAVYSHVL
jgi:hypothetical protein